MDGIVQTAPPGGPSLVCGVQSFVRSFVRSFARSRVCGCYENQNRVCGLPTRSLTLSVKCLLVVVVDKSSPRVADDILPLLHSVTTRRILVDETARER